MGLRPWEFDRLTPREFAGMAAGYRKRQEQEWYRVATLACYIGQPYSKKKLTPEKLLGLPPKGGDNRRVKLVVNPQGDKPWEL